MPSAAEAAVLDYVQSGAFPQTEETAVARISDGDFGRIRRDIEGARQAARKDLSKLSQTGSHKVDAWIKQARDLQGDIERSKAIAREIVLEAEQAAVTQSQSDDHTKKAALLKSELQFNRALEQALRSAQDVATALSAGHAAASNGDLHAALEHHNTGITKLKGLQQLGNTNASNILLQRLDKLKDSLSDAISAEWDRLLVFDTTPPRLTIGSGQGSSKTDITQVVDLAASLGILYGKLTRFCRQLDQLVFSRLLESQNDQTFALEISKSTVSFTKREPSAALLLDDLTRLIEFLNNALPDQVTSDVSENLLPGVVSRLIADWLPAAIPISVHEVDHFDALIARASQFSVFLANAGWHGGADLDDWVQQGPKNWLAKRRETALALVRQILSEQVGVSKKAERFETRQLDHTDDNGDAGDDWDASWDNDDAPSRKASQLPVDAPADAPVEEDMSAWDDQSPAQSPNARKKSATASGEEEEAWGWDEPETPGVRKPGEASDDRKSLSNGVNGSKPRQATLKEIYTVTGIPDEILSSIKQLTDDGAYLNSAENSKASVAPAAGALYSIPTLILAGYRALSSSFYTGIDGGNMFLYNDTVRLSNELTSLVANLESLDADAVKRLKLANDIEALEAFGKRAYGKEMQSQRTILHDFLDGAQGFANCTDEPFASSCDGAIAMVVDRLRQVAKEWKPILSENAWLQSLGSLLNTVITKITADVCDLPDISEEQSARLRSHCDAVAKLSDLFAAQDAQRPDQEAPERTAVYVPSWIRFQYLGEMLEASLADIEYFWRETELRLDFDAGEVADLVEALFADSDRRRRTIAELRRG